MVDNAKIVECFSSLVGWRDSDNACYARLTEQLKRSDSGLIFNDLNELISIKTIDAIKEESTTINQYLTRITNDSILNLINSFQVNQAYKNASRSLLENKTVMLGAGSMQDKVNKLGRFVGFEIRLKNINNITAVIKKIALQLDTVQPTGLFLYVYESSQYEKIMDIEVVPSKANSVQWFDLEKLTIPKNLNLSHKSDTSGGGQTYYIGYYEDDLIGNAIKKDFYALGCGCPNDTYKDYSKYMHIRAISIDAANTSIDRNLFDIAPDKVTYESHNFGLNLEPFVFCDITQILCGSRMLFAEALQLQVAIRVLAGVISSNEINVLTERSKGDAYALMKNYQLQLNGGKDEESKIYYPGKMSKLNLDFTGMDRVCLPERTSAISMGDIRR